jgi:aspartate oxidase
LVAAQQECREIPIPESVVLKIRTLLWDLVGVVRTKEGLATAVDQLETIDKQLPTNIPGSSRALLLSARVIAQAALLRKESVGSHYRSDAPYSNEASLRHSTVTVSLRNPYRLVAEFEEETGGEPIAGSASVQTRAQRESTPAITV